MPQTRPPKPTLQPTRPSTLFVAALGAAAVGLLMVTTFYGSIPAASWLSSVTLMLVALVCAYTAFATKARIERRPGTRPVEALSIARYAAFAKACSLGGALFSGWYAAILVYTIAQRNRLSAAAEELLPTAFTFASSLALVAAALWLERACRIPKRPDDDETDTDRRDQGGNGAGDRGA